MRDILYTLAYDNARRLVAAKDAIRGQSYWCPGCEAKMVSRRSDEQRKGAKRPHFAHLHDGRSCTPETALHKAFKHILSERIQLHLTNGEPLVVTWQCKTCHRAHACDILRDIKYVAIERTIGPCRPDISLTDNDNKVQWAIEVVVSHEPEPETLGYYQNESITLVQFDLRDDDDLERARETPLAPNKVDLCNESNCALCGTPKLHEHLWVVEGSCRCRAPRRIAFISGPDSLTGPYRFPARFTPEQSRLAEERDVTLKRSDRSEGIEQGLSNYCPKCKRVDQTVDLVNTYVMPAISGMLRSDKYVVGSYCGECTRKELAAQRKRMEM